MSHGPGAPPPRQQDGHETDHHLQLRTLSMDDYERVRELSGRVYRMVSKPWEREEIQQMLDRFPDGQICIEDKGLVVAVALTMIVDFRQVGEDHTYMEVVGESGLAAHDPDGDFLYGIEIFVDPEYQGMRLGRRLYAARKELCESLNLKGILVGGRIPGYQRHAGEMTPRQYIDAVRRREIHDPVLSFQLANGFHVKRRLKGYWPDDQPSLGNAVLLEWRNIDFERRPRLIGSTKSVVRLGVVQWRMRRFADLDDFLQQVEFFVDTVSDYGSDLVLFPELMNAPLIHSFDERSPAEAMRALAGYTDELRQAMLEMAVSYNTNVVTGSFPEIGEDGRLYNVSHLCRRDGTWDSQYKLHITPDELSSWGLSGGAGLKVFDTDVGKVGILICYDVEFPELARLMVERGARILLVPFWTDTRNAYLRVRLCAQARAVENECYVAISGSVGNIPKVETMGLQYSQAAVFTPSDFAFPHDATAAEATPGVETTLLTDLDMDLIKHLRRKGSVRNMASRRRDLYRLRWIG